MCAYVYKALAQRSQSLCYIPLKNKQFMNIVILDNTHMLQRYQSTNDINHHLPPTHQVMCVLLKSLVLIEWESVHVPPANRYVGNTGSELLLNQVKRDVDN